MNGFSKCRLLKLPRYVNYPMTTYPNSCGLRPSWFCLQGKLVPLERLGFGGTPAPEAVQASWEQWSARQMGAKHACHEDDREGGQVLKGVIGSFDEHDRLLVSREPALRRHRGEADAPPYRVMGLKFVCLADQPGRGPALFGHQGTALTAGVGSTMPTATRSTTGHPCPSM